MIDTHCHLTYQPLASQLEGVLRRAREAGVTHCIAIGTGIADSRASLELAGLFPEVACTVGVHPSSAHREPSDLAEPLEIMASAPEVVAIGETGLDLYHDTSTRPQQTSAFTEQMRLAEQIEKPVVIHSRSAVDECLAVMADFPKVAAVFHCFTGSIEEARRVIERGYYLGFTGPVTYRRSDGLREVVRMVPGERLLVETDAPYLSPEPVRGKRPCEPAFVMHTARKVAEVRGMTLEELDEVTTANARRLFDWPPPPEAGQG